MLYRPGIRRGGSRYPLTKSRDVLCRLPEGSHPQPAAASQEGGLPTGTAGLSQTAGPKMRGANGLPQVYGRISKTWYSSEIKDLGKLDECVISNTSVVFLAGILGRPQVMEGHRADWLHSPAKILDPNPY